ncbi:MAG TPA: SufE family protein [Balneolales bacterium]|nr:SufE family protein [Balneolales bacterium]
MTIPEIQDRIVREFSLFDDWTEKYEHVIKQGRKLEALPEDYRLDENKVKGCQSQVWLHAELDGDKVKFYADSDAMIVKGLVSLLLRVYSDQKPEEILKYPPEFIKKIDMDTHLSPTRANGLVAMVKQIQFYAMAFKTKLEADKA